MDLKELDFVQFTTKEVVNACKMNRKEAEEVMGRKFYPDSEDREDEEGFLIVYPYGNKSWCPSHIFYQRYKRSDNYIDRMIVEREEVRERYLAGRDFTFSDAFNENLDDEERDMLRKQLDAMEGYLYILNKRIFVAKKKEYKVATEGVRQATGRAEE